MRAYGRRTVPLRHVLSSEGLHMKEAFATAVVLLVMVLLINAVSSFFAKKLTKGPAGEEWIKLR